VVDALELAVEHEGGRVVDVQVEVDETDHGGDAFGRRHHLVQLAQVVADEAGLQEEVLGGVAGQGQLGEYDQVGLLAARPRHPVDDLLGVAAQVAHGAVDLGQRHSQRTREVGLHGFIVPPSRG